MGRTLALTSPLTQGDDVRFSQECLQGRKGDYAAFYTGALHGIYDEATADAAKKAKYYLGFPLEAIDRTCGDLLRGLLQSTPAALPPDNIVRREARLNPPPIPTRLQALATARTQLGVKESPAGSNRVAFSAWYGITGPWCAMFVTWCFSQHDSASFARGSRYAYCPFIVADARAGHNQLQVVTAPVPGDLVLYDWERDGVADHVGIFESGNAQAFQTIEGNTSIGNDSNGGEVMRRQRDASVVQCFVRVGS